MNDQVYHLIKSIKRITGFLGVPGKPTPISEAEVTKIMGKIEDGALKPSTSISFDIGEQVRVCDGLGVFHVGAEQSFVHHYRPSI